MTGAAWLHGKVKVRLPDGAELSAPPPSSRPTEMGREVRLWHVLAGIEAVVYVLSRSVL